VAPSTHPQPPFGVATVRRQQQPTASRAQHPQLRGDPSILTLSPFRARAEFLAGERVAGCVAPISGGKSNPDIPSRH